MAVVGAGVIGTGQAQYLDVTLEGGRTYSFSVHPSEPGVDFDLTSTTRTGTSWPGTRARPQTRTAVRSPPLITGPFRIVVNAVAGMSTYRVEVFA